MKFPNFNCYFLNYNWKWCSCRWRRRRSRRTQIKIQCLSKNNNKWHQQQQQWLCCNRLRLQIISHTDHKRTNQRISNRNHMFHFPPNIRGTVWRCGYGVYMTTRGVGKKEHVVDCWQTNKKKQSCTLYPSFAQLTDWPTNRILKTWWRQTKDEKKEKQ